MSLYYVNQYVFVYCLLRQRKMLLNMSFEASSLRCLHLFKFTSKYTQELTILLIHIGRGLDVNISNILMILNVPKRNIQQKFEMLTISTNSTRISLNLFS